MVTAWKSIYDDIVDQLLAVLSSITFSSPDVNNQTAFQSVARGPAQAIKGPFPMAIVVPERVDIQPSNFQKTTHHFYYSITLHNLKSNASYSEMMDDMVCLLGEVYDTFLDRLSATNNRSLDGLVDDLEIERLTPIVQEGKNRMIFTKGEISLYCRKLL